ncbi:MAG: GAF domain-containing protein [Anaerolineales bacterium]|nr:GAF domain-containing protein [Anaerolineales bacterium]
MRKLFNPAVALMNHLIGKLPLQIVMAAPFVLIIMGAVGLTGYLAFRNGQNAVTNLAGQLQHEVTARIQQHLDAYLATPRLINQLNLDGIQLGQLDAYNLEAMEQHFLTQIQRFDSVISLAYASEQREYVGATRKTLGVDWVAAIASAKTGYTLEAYKIMPQGGRELVNSLPDYDPRPRPWYQAAVQAGQPTWTPIFMWSSGDVGLDAVVPIYAADKHLLGVLDTSLTLKGLGDFLQSLPVSKNGETFIVDRDGLLVASSTITQPFIRVGDDIKRLSALESADPVAQSATHSLEQQFGTLANISTAQPFYFDLAGERQFAQATPYRDEYGLDWLIVVAIPESDFMAHINANNRNTTLLIAVSLLGAIAIATLTARWVTRPVLRLNQSARALAQGDWTQRMATNRHDEVGQLARSFNWMAEQLQASFASLQASEERYRSLFTNSLDAVLLGRPDGSILAANEAACRLFGKTEEELRQGGRSSILDASDPRLASGLAERGRTGKFSGELTFVRNDGTKFLGEMTSTIFTDQNGEQKSSIIIRDVTERQQAEKALNRYAGRLEVLHEIDRAILAAHSPQEIAQTALRHIRRLVPCRRTALVLLDSETNEVVYLSVEVENETQVKAGIHLPAEGFQFIIDELRKGQIFVHADPRSLPMGNILFAEGIRTGISLPLLTNEALIGAVSLWTDHPDAFSEEDVKIARGVADQLAIAIQQAQLFEAEAQRRQEAEALRDTAAALNSTLNLEDVLDRILSNVGRVVQHKLVNIALIEAGLTHVVRAQGYAEQGRAEAVLKSQHSLADTPILRRMVETGQPVVIPETQNHPDWVVKDESWLRAYVGVPIRVQSEVIGILNLDSATPGVFTSADAERLQAFADQAAIAIQNARLYTKSEQHAERLHVLHEIDRAILAARSPEEIAQIALRHIRRLASCRRTAVSVFDFPANEILTLAVDVDTETRTKAGTRTPLDLYNNMIGELRLGKVISARVDAMPDALPPKIIEAASAEGTHFGTLFPLIAHGELIGSVNLWETSPTVFSVDQVDIVREVADQLAIALENARLFEQVQRYTEELEQRVADRTRELTALYEVTAVASESLDLKMMLKLILERVLGAMRSQIGVIHLLNETGETLHLAVQQNLPHELAAQLEMLPVGTGLPGRVIKNGDPLIVPDVAVDPRSVEAGRISFQAYVGVPMRARGQMLGVLSVARAKEQPHFNVEEIALLTTIADQVGVVVESARLRQMAERSAVMEERARLARDLHDSVTQLLYSVNLFAKVGREAFELGDMAQVNNCLAELGQIAQQALKEMRLLVYELRPLALAQEGLVGALRQRLDAVERRSGVQAQLQAEMMLDLPSPVEEALYHITLEALNNALKHAAATAIIVSIGASDGRIDLEVADNGSGFDPQAVAGKGGLGLTSMRERVEKLGGTLVILSGPKEGTKVKVTLEVYG